jgi:hypothetical protein
LTGRIPARVVAGGEGKETGEQEEVKAHLMVCLDGPEMVGVRWSTASRATAAEKNSGRSSGNGGEVALVENR